MRGAANSVSHMKQIIGAEIGVWRGANAAEMLQHLDVKKFYLIDPYNLSGGMNIIGNGNHDLAYVRDRANKLFKEAEGMAHKEIERFGDKVVWIRKQSHLAAEEVKEELDFVYIDGNHTYPLVMTDITVWTPKVKEGGVVGGHDLNIKDVRKALEDYCRINKIKYDHSGTDWWFIK